MIKLKTIEYSNTDRTFQGVIAWDDAFQGKTTRCADCPCLWRSIQI